MLDPNFEGPRTSRRTAADALRILAIDAAEATRSTHPAMAVRMADVASVLWRSHLRHNPADPQWWNRDRFVASSSHASVLLDSLLHLSGYDVTLDEIRGLRRRTAHAPGHPPVMHMPGIAMTTGPLGAGIANAVGIALAERMLAARFNRPDLDVVDHRTYAMVEGHCLQESESREACTLAADWRLAKLTVISDDAGIPLDGATDSWYRDATVARFRAYGWNVIGPVDSDAPGAIDRAIRMSHASTDAPTLIICRTRPLRTCTGPTAMRESLGWPHGPFEIPVTIRAMWDARAKGAAAQAEWQALFDVWSARHPDDASELSRRLGSELSDDASAFGRRMIEASLGRMAPSPHRKTLGPIRVVTPPALAGCGLDRTVEARSREAAVRPASAPAPGVAVPSSIA